MYKRISSMILVMLIVLTFLNDTPFVMAQEILKSPEIVDVDGYANENDEKVKISVKWNAVDGAEGYEIFSRKQTESKTWDDWISVGKTTDNYYSASFDMTSRERYGQVRIRAYNGEGYSNYSKVYRISLDSAHISESPTQISSYNLYLYVGDTDTLMLYNATDPFTWESSDKSIATVDANGVVIAKKKGECKITALMGSNKLICDVLVQDYTKQIAYRNQLTKYISKSSLFTLLDIDQNGTKELIIRDSHSAASIEHKNYIYTFYKGKLNCLETVDHGDLYYYKQSKCLKNDIFGYGSLSLNGNPKGWIEYYKISKGKPVSVKKVSCKGKKLEVKWYDITQANITKYIKDGLK